MIRAQPMDAVVLCGCDKRCRWPMGAASADVPAVLSLAGPMMRWPIAVSGSVPAPTAGAWAKYRAGGITAAEIERIEENLATTRTCAVMGTMSTMASIAEGWESRCPAPPRFPPCTPIACARPRRAVSRRWRSATTGIRPSQIITGPSVENALRVLLAIGGSTNALIHLTAVASRVDVEVSLRRLNALSDETPVLVDLKPTGQHYMSDPERGRRPRRRAARAGAAAAASTVSR